LCRNTDVDYLHRCEIFLTAFATESTAWVGYSSLRASQPERAAIRYLKGQRPMTLRKTRQENSRHSKTRSEA